MTKPVLDPFSDGDLFLQHFLPGTSPWVRKCRSEIYRINVAHKLKGMVPLILITGQRGVGKGYAAHLIAAHLAWLVRSKGEDIPPSDEADIYQLARSANFRKQALTGVPETLAEGMMFGVRKGAYTDATKDKKGLFETNELIDVFLDEIGDAPGIVQAKLLDILETRTFRPLGPSFDEKEQLSQARIITATNRNLSELVHKGVFRSDLYDRLQWFRIELPPLVEQLDELPAIIKSVNRPLCTKYDLQRREPSDEDIKWCQTSYSWPGNHRELQQVLWKWHLGHLFGGTISLKSIVEERSAQTLPNEEELEDVVVPRLFNWFEAILARREPGFSTYGEYANELLNLAHKAIYLFKERRQLTNADLLLLFTKQDPINVRKQISGNRPTEKE